MNMLRHFARFAGIMVVLAVSACAQHAVLPGSAPAQMQGYASAVFTMHWPTPAPGVRPSYISPSTQSLSVQINNAQSLAAVVNNPGTGGTSRVTIDAPVGTDAFIIEAYDLTNAQGTVLSQAQVSQKIVAGKANTISAVLQGVVASIGVSLSNPSPVAGASTTSSVMVTAKDPDGNVIVGPGNYDQAIHVSDSDSFATSLSSSVVTAPGLGPTLNYNGNSISSAVITASLAGVPSSTATFSPTPHVYEFAIATTNSGPAGIAAGPDGALWFTEQQNIGKIGRITTGGSISEFSIPTGGSAPVAIATGPDGALWFTESNTNKIGRITTGGSFTEYSVPTSNSGPAGIAAGSDGALWFAENNANKIGRITTGGSFNELAVPTSSSGPSYIASGPDGALWFTEGAGNNIGRVTTSGTFYEVAVPTASSGPAGIAAGPDGALWFTEFNASKIGRIATSGSITEFAVPSASSDPFGIAAGADGALWFAEFNASKIGRIATSGSITEFAVPTPNSAPAGITSGPDGAFWFTEQGADKIGRLAY